MRYAQLVIGPAGSGKSTYCNAMLQHGVDVKREIHVVNLDPAAEHFSYQPLVDIRELIQVQDSMEDLELQYGPNGGLIFCVEYLLQNAEWLREQLGEIEDDYILFDCPGQIELYIHLNAMQKLIQILQSWNFSVCCIYLVDVQFMTDSAKFLSGTMSALSAMLNLEAPHINVLSKMDLLGKHNKKQLEKFLVPDPHALLGDMELNLPRFNDKYRKLSQVIGNLITDYSWVRFRPLDLNDEENIADLLLTIDNVLQFGEDRDFKTKDFEDNYDDKN